MVSSLEDMQQENTEDETAVTADEADTDTVATDTAVIQDDEPCWILAVGGEGRDYAPSVIDTGDGYVVVGMTTSYGLGSGNNNQNGSHDFMAIRLDRKGDLIWCTVVGGPQDERGSFSVSPTSDEGFILTGTTQSYGSGGSDIFVVKLDARGRLVWARTIGGQGQETGKTTLELDDGYITLGDTNTAGAGQSDLLAVRYDFNGNIIWARAIGGTQNDNGAGICRADNGFVIGGTIWSFGAGGADAGLIKLDDSGNILWSRTIGGTGDEGINWDGVRVMDDGGFVLGEGTTSYGANNQAICCMRLEPDCSIRWAVMVDGPQDDAGWTMNRVSDGYVAGGKFGMGQDGGDVVFIKFDDDGRLLWARTLGGQKLDEIEEIIQTDSGYIMSGVTRLAEPNGDFLIARVGSNGFAGEDDIIEELEGMTLTAINPVSASFSPVVTDMISDIHIQAVNPNVENPNAGVSLIYSNN